MAWTPATFKARFPEFLATDDSVVQSVLNEAAARVDGSFGDTDTGVGYLTAHILSMQPYGQNARLESDDGTTTYGKLFDEWVRNRAGGPWITGQAATPGGSIW